MTAAPVGRAAGAPTAPGPGPARSPRRHRRLAAAAVLAATVALLVARPDPAAAAGASSAATGALAAPSPAPTGVYTTAYADPAQIGIVLDYQDPIPGPDGQAATLAPLSPSVIAPALADTEYLDYETIDDLGGFVPAKLHWSALSSGAVDVVGSKTGKAEINRYAEADGNQITSFGLLPGQQPADFEPDNGVGPVSGLGQPTTPSLPLTTLPPAANQSFGAGPVLPTSGSGRPPLTYPGTGGQLPPGRQPGTPTVGPVGPTSVTVPTTVVTTPTTTPPPTVPTTTPTTVPTTTPTTLAPVSTTTTYSPPVSYPTGGGGGAPAPASCGSGSLVMTSDHDTCSLDAYGMYPGSGASEVMTIQNATNAPFTLSVEATGTPTRFWDDLSMDIWDVADGSTDPSTWDSLDSWTTSHTIESIPAGGSVQIEVGLYLGSWAGNADMNQAADFDLVWTAQG